MCIRDRRLRRGGANVLVLDRESFPRLKLCAGWVTPQVLADLEIDPGVYPHRFLTFERLHVHFGRLHFRVPCVQHSIRRYEFDAWLLERSGAPVVRHLARSIRREGSDWIVDDAFRARYVVGAGGTRCPVYRQVFKPSRPRERELQAVTLEEEFPCDWQDGDCHLWFFQDGLPGYSWYVPKADGYLNVGIGGMAERLLGRGDDIRRHWARFSGMLGRSLVARDDWNPQGYSYYQMCIRDSSCVCRY